MSPSPLKHCLSLTCVVATLPLLTAFLFPLAFHTLNTYGPLALLLGLFQALSPRGPLQRVREQHRLCLTPGAWGSPYFQKHTVDPPCETVVLTETSGPSLPMNIRGRADSGPHCTMPSWKWGCPGGGDLLTLTLVPRTGRCCTWPCGTGQTHPFWWMARM